MVENDPENPCDWELFRAYVQAFVKHKCKLTLETEPDTPKKTILYSQPSLAELIAAENEGYKVVVKNLGGDPKSFESTVHKGELVLRMRCRSTDFGESADPRTYRGSVNEKVSAQKIENTEKADQEEEVEEGEPEFAIFLRSPQGVIYYLGEIMRVWNLDSQQAIEKKLIPVVQLCSSGEKAFTCLDPPTKNCDSQASTALCIPLFLAREPNSDCSRGSVEVTYEGKPYIIPKLPESALQEISPELCHPGRSMQALTLVSQLISLQKKGEELPGTALVRVVGD